MVFIQTATLPLAACVSHAHTGVTALRRCCCKTLTTHDRQTAGFSVCGFSPSRDRQTDGCQTVTVAYLLSARCSQQQEAVKCTRNDIITISLIKLCLSAKCKVPFIVTSADILSLIFIKRAAMYSAVLL